MQPNGRLQDSAESLPSRRDQIVAAAALLFGAQGYHGTSMQDIGERVGLLKGSLYAHVANKEELLLEIVSRADRAFSAALAPVWSLPEAAPQKLRLAMRMHLKTSSALGPLARVYLLEARHLSGDPARWLRQARERYQAFWRQMIAEGVAAGTLRSDLDPALTTWLALAALNAGAQEEMPDQLEELERRADRIADLLLRGLLPRTEQAG